MSVRLKFAGGSVIPSAPTVLFGNLNWLSFTDAARGYDVASDGRFLMKIPIPESAEERTRKIYPSTLRVVLNWTNELQPK